MEPDGVTRLYYCYEQPSIKVAEAYPDNTNWRNGSWINSSQAKKIYNRAEFICVSAHFFGDTCSREIKYNWGVYPQGIKANKRFEVERSHPYTDKDYEDLIRELQRRTHKKGLTVLIS